MKIMGYWDTYPLAGDSPMDSVCDVIRSLYKSKKAFEKDFYADEDEEVAAAIRKVAKLLKNALPSLCKKAEKMLGEMSFVLPFMVIQREIIVKDPKISATLKEMIADGGASMREYNIPDEGKKGYPTRANKWNRLKSPFDHAVKLYDLWDLIMSEKIPFSAMESRPGLLEKILIHIESGKKGLINVD